MLMQRQHQNQDISSNQTRTVKTDETTTSSKKRKVVAASESPVQQCQNISIQLFEEGGVNTGGSGGGCRYPKRNVPVKNYKELDVPDDDDFVC